MRAVMTILVGGQAVEKGSIVAPAGCGKTQLIADTLKTSGCEDGRPYLVLTHTNAGKAALEQRLKKLQVPPTRYRIWTIDSWCIRLAKRFPLGCGIDSSTLLFSNPKVDYPALREAVLRLLVAGHVNDALRSTYAGALVDEYQDCGVLQHRIVEKMLDCFSVVVFGDPLQSIFGFSGPVVDWSNEVLPAFPQVIELTYPWRWTNAGSPELGQWLLECRLALQEHRGIDLRSSPESVEWIPISERSDVAHAQRMKAASISAGKDGTVLIIGESTSKTGQRMIAQMTPGATTVESVDLGDFIEFSSRFDPLASDASSVLVSFAAELMTGLSATALNSRLDVLARGSARTPPTPIESAVLPFKLSPSLTGAADVLSALWEQKGVRVYRPDVLRMCIAALRVTANGKSFAEAALELRERNRHSARHISKKAVGSTLLLKGLESDIVVVMHPDKMDRANLYVALTRGARRVIVCSASPILAG